MATSVGIWDRLSPGEFKQLQEYTKYSKRRLKDVLMEFREGIYPKYSTEKPMDYAGFKLFMSSYLGNDISDELCQTLFFTFHKKVPLSEVTSPELPRALLKKFLAHNSALSVDSLHAHGNDYFRIAKGTRKATMVATATVVAGGFGSTDRKAVLSADTGIEMDSESESTDPSYSTSLSLFDSKAKSLSTISKTGESKRKAFSELNSHPGSQQSHSVDDELLDYKNLRYVPMVSIKEIACYLSLLEGSRVEDKLEFVFRVYDSDGNDYLDQQELESIVQQMVSVAEYLGWDTSTLKPIFSDMLSELDFDSDGQISLDEWLKGGMENIPLQVLLGLDVRVDEEGKHQWTMKHFKGPAYCNICHGALSGFARRQGLQCIFCKFTAHERCVARVPASCIKTYTKSKIKAQKMDHHWIEGNCPGKCDKCGKNIKSSCLTGLRCAWCQTMVHNKCVPHVSQECTLGRHRDHILPPICMTPMTLTKQEEERKNDEGKKNSVISFDGMVMQISPLPGTHPLVVFVNPKSGGRQGARLLNKFRYLLNPRQVFNLAEGGPLAGLKFFSQVSNFRVLCCGGDGTVGWVLSTVDRLTSLRPKPPVAILPLGTGNDLSRCLNWGGGYEGGSLCKVLQRIQHSNIDMLDRWNIDITETESNDACVPIPLNILNNYFSIGVDASIALKFHLQREKNPEKFNSRLKNKLRYFEAGTAEQLSASCKRLQEDIEVECDGQKLDLLSGPNLEGIAIINIPSVYGGANLWGEVDKKKRRPKENGVKDVNTLQQDIGDRCIEVIGLENVLYVGQIIAGVRQHGLRLAQCSTLTIRTRRPLPMQVDGEPWLQSPASITITHKNQAPMLRPPSHSRRGFLGINWHSSNKRSTVVE
ncbi:diacylglycerol kinase beta-like isoform X2 [Rhopilema esculentum]|uniref:diacylglycerol kinase beta-like isoform X2 n=1 Tax=Rhopilema esculentum TaxID=499914 RepID=UPI0031DD102D